ncbi:hypothetical protein QUB63_22785 [Microcoleus sp. ARI1-B5]|uniref:hypothetical protein n=1 Tax=unclassified Microcoleus TaxID=2642155 RepID=UPI002FD6E891
MMQEVYRDLVPSYKTIDNFLANYPKETDFWEVQNKNLTQKLLVQNPALDWPEIGSEVGPTNRLPDGRASIVSIA